MKGYKIYGKYQKKSHDKKWIISSLPSVFGPKLVQVPAHYPIDEVRNLARRLLPRNLAKALLLLKKKMLLLYG